MRYVGGSDSAGAFCSSLVSDSLSSTADCGYR